eukprot:jgi/Mesen1/1749/ME001390S00748
MTGCYFKGYFQQQQRSCWEHSPPTVQIFIFTPISVCPTRVRALKVADELTEIRALSTEDIQEQVIDLKGELFFLRVAKASRKEFKTHDFKRIRRKEMDTVAFDQLGNMSMTTISKQRKKQQPAVMAELEERLRKVNADVPFPHSRGNRAPSGRPTATRADPSKAIGAEHGRLCREHMAALLDKGDASGARVGARLSTLLLVLVVVIGFNWFSWETARESKEVQRSLLFARDKLDGRAFPQNYELEVLAE